MLSKLTESSAECSFFTFLLKIFDMAQIEPVRQVGFELLNKQSKHKIFYSGLSVGKNYLTS